jgi:hypothetical protein
MRQVVTNRRFRNSVQRLAILGAVLIMSTACQDLDVENLNSPDRERALANAQDLEALLSGNWESWFTLTHNTGNTMEGFIPISTSMTMLGQAAEELSREPRQPFRNEDIAGAAGGRWIPSWRVLHAMASVTHDAMQTIDELDLTFTEGTTDVTPRALAFAKFTQGVAFGYLGLIFDRAIIIDETVPYAANVSEQAVEYLLSGAEGPNSDITEAALAALDEAIAIATANPTISFPGNQVAGRWFGTVGAVNGATFIRMANSMAARILILSARNIEQRNQVDWARALQYLANGVTTDFEMRLAQGVRTSIALQYMQNEHAACLLACARLRYQFLGMSDISGAYQEWLTRSIPARDRIDIISPDRRIMGPTPQSEGAYVRYLDHNNGFPDVFGSYRRSAYHWSRHKNRGMDGGNGLARILTVDEKNLFRAEALLHEGDIPGAVDLINGTRTRGGTLPLNQGPYVGLPAVTAAGVPQSADCVPRTDAGACGDLMAALRYERLLENYALDAMYGYFDSRGFGMLIEGQFEQAPLPIEELELLDLPTYTYGGGFPSSATYRPATMADVN